MKNKMKFFGTQSQRLCFIALVAVIGFVFIACSNGGGGGGGSRGGGATTGGVVPTIGSGIYTGTDGSGNTYKLYVGSSIPSRAAIKGDAFRLEITTKDGKTSTVTGKVTDISTDGTLKLKPVEMGVEPIAVVVKGNSSLNSVASATGEVLEFTLDDGTKFMPRTFDTIYLRATRWSGPIQRGEHMGSGLSVLVKDYPTDPTALNELKTSDYRYVITLSGTSDRALDHLQIEVQGLTESDDWIWLGGGSGTQVRANQPFDQTIPLNIGNDSTVSYKLGDYKEIILQVTNVFNYYNDEHSDWKNEWGTIPANIPDFEIMATITNFKISLKQIDPPANGVNAQGLYFTWNENSYSVSGKDATGAVVIPSTYNDLPVTEIGEKGFMDNKNITSITIPNGVTTIHHSAFEDCTNLTSITIPNSVTRIFWAAFSGCKSLKSITLPNRLTPDIGYGTFADCESLTSITIPNGVTTNIGYGTFEGCESLTSITIPNGVKRIEGSAFEGCVNLTSITIPYSVTSIGDEFGGVFKRCKSLKSITIPNSVTSIDGGWVFQECESLTSITIPNGVPSIGDGVFNGCTSLKSITIPNSVTSIGDWAFTGCESLETVNYGGTQAQWNAITIGDGNEALTNAK